MARSPRWQSTLATALEEACLAVRLYNDPQEPRSFESFVVHMHLAWLYLLHAEFTRDGIDFRYHDPKQPRRLVKVDGEPKSWELEKSCRERWPNQNDPVRANLEFFVSLRNKIEHRYTRLQETLSISLAGHSQALLLNFENEVVNQFGTKHSLATKLRFPVFIGTFTLPGEQTLTALRKNLPAPLKRFIAEYHTKLSPEIEKDQRFSLRLRVTLDLANRGASDIAIKFTKLEDLSPEQITALEEIGKTGHVIQRERLRKVNNLGEYSPRRLVEKVNREIPFTFNMGHATSAWKKHKIRPPAGDPNPERTVETYCTWDDRHDDYGYTEAWAKKLIKECSTREGFRTFIGREPPEHYVKPLPPWSHGPN